MAGPAGAGSGSGQKRGRPGAANASTNSNNAVQFENPSAGAVHQPSPGPNLCPALQVIPNFADQHSKRIVMALQSGLKGELAWAINALTLLSFKEKDDTRKDATPLAKVPGLLDSLLHVISEWRDIAQERVFAKLSRPRLLGADQPYTGFGLEYEIVTPDDALVHIRGAAEKNSEGEEAEEAREGWCWDEEGLFNLDEIGRNEKQICAVAVSNVLRNLSFMPENEASMAQHRRCLETLITVLEDHEMEDEELVTNSVETLLNLAPFLCFKNFTNNGSSKGSNSGSAMSEKRVIDAILMMLFSPVVPWHCSAAELLGRLVVNPDNEPALLPSVSQIFPRLVELLSADASGDAVAASVAALHNFAEINTDCRLRLASERWAVGRLLRVVSSGRDHPQEICRKAALTLESLASEPQNRAVMFSFESQIAELAVVDLRMSDVFARILWELSSGVALQVAPSLECPTSEFQENQYSPFSSVLISELAGMRLLHIGYIGRIFILRTFDSSWISLMGWVGGNGRTRLLKPKLKLCASGRDVLTDRVKMLLATSLTGGRMLMFALLGDKATPSMNRRIHWVACSTTLMSAHRHSQLRH